MNTQITYNNETLETTKEHEIFPRENKILHVELIGKWHDGSPLHQICTCATEVHINYQLGYGEVDNTPRVVIESDILSTGSTYNLAQLNTIVIKEVPFGFFDIQ